MTRDRKETQDTQRGRPCDNGGRGRSEAAMSRGVPSLWYQKPEAARKDSPLELSEGAQSCRRLDFGFLAFRTVNE